MKYKKMTFVQVLSIYLSCLFLSFVLLISCDSNETEDLQLSRLFSPTSFKATMETNIVDLSWVPISGATYVLEISKDSFLFENELQTILFDDKVEYHLDDLFGRTRYSARIKAVSTDPSIADSKFTAITFTTGIENIFYAVEDDDIGFTTMLLKWDKSKNVSHIVVSTSGSTDITVPLSEVDQTAGEKLIEGLSAATDYTFTIYLEERNRGVATATTSRSLTSIQVDQSQDGTWYELGTYYFFANAGAYVEIRNENTVGYVLVDAIKFSRDGYEDIIIDNTDPNVTAVGPWVTSTTSSNRIGENYLHDGKKNKGLCSIKFSPALPVSGSWTVYMYWYKNSSWSKTTPVDIFAGD